MAAPPEQSQIVHRRLQREGEPFFLAEKGKAPCSKVSSSVSKSGPVM